MWSRARPCSFFVPDLRRRRAVPKKKPRRNGAKSNGRKYPNRGMVLLSESEVLRKAVIAIPKGLWRPVVTAPHQLTAADPEPNARARVDGLTLDGLHPPVSPSVQQILPRPPPVAGAFSLAVLLVARGRPRISLALHPGYWCFPETYGNNPNRVVRSSRVTRRSTQPGRERRGGAGQRPWLRTTQGRTANNVTHHMMK